MLIKTIAMNFSDIKLISFDAFDTLIRIPKSTLWIQEAFKKIENLPENFDPVALRRQLLCTPTPGIEALRQLQLLNEEQLESISKLIHQEHSSIEAVIFAKEVVEQASQKYKTALISNLGQDYGAPALSVLNHSFDHVLFSYEVGHVKPEREIFDKLITDSGLQPHQILHVGNSYDSDYLGATGVGMQSIHLDLRNKQKTQHRIQTIGELANYL